MTSSRNQTMDTFSNNGRRQGLGTAAVWTGETRVHGEATQVPVVTSVSFGYRDLDGWYDVATKRTKGHIYGRNSNPTVAVFEEKMRVLEGAEAATAASTGMAAISSALFALVKSGQRVVSVKDSYGGTNLIFQEHLPSIGVDVKLCDTTDHEALEAEMAKGCDVLYLESPTNPTMKVVDIERLAKKGHEQGAVVMVDNTFATPLNQRPLQLGADLVIHSATKFIGGHADALGGVVCGSKSLVEKIHRYREIMGASMHPEAAYLMVRSLKTLHLRIRQQNENAMAIAKFLKGRPGIEAVYYPGLEAHPQHEIARRQMIAGYGGMLAFSLEGGLDAIKRFLPALEYAHLAANLGAVETVAAPPRTSSHVECTPEQRAAMGIPEGLVRYSAGIEDTEDLMADLKQALEVIR